MDCKPLSARYDLFARACRAGVLLFGSWTLVACASPGGQTDDWKRTEIARRYDSYRDEFPDVGSLTANELIELQRSGEQTVVLVDVRTEAERAVSTLPGAISKEEFERDPERYANATVVAYCTIGYRSGIYVAELHQRGREILNLEGSILSWTHAGGELISADGPTDEVHVYDRGWNLVSGEYEAVW